MYCKRQYMLFINFYNCFFIYFSIFNLRHSCCLDSRQLNPKFPTNRRAYFTLPRYSHAPLLSPTPILYPTAREQEEGAAALEHGSAGGGGGARSWRGAASAARGAREAAVDTAASGAEVRMPGCWLRLRAAAAHIAHRVYNPGTSSSDLPSPLPLLCPITFFSSSSTSPLLSRVWRFLQSGMGARLRTGYLLEATPGESLHPPAPSSLLIAGRLNQAFKMVLRDLDLFLLD